MSSTTATVVLAGATVLLALVAFGQLIMSARSEGRRTQPIALAHRAGQPKLGEYAVFLTNEGTGSAFNVRFGVKLDGVEYPAGAGRGSRYLVPAGGRVPEPVDQTLTIKVPHAPYGLARKGHGVSDRAIFFARYEDAVGRTWETGNPTNPESDLKIGRGPLFLRLHDTRQARRRARDERVFDRRIKEEFEVELDLSRLSRRQRMRRRLGR